MSDGARRVLVVDDDEDIRMVAEMSLARIGGLSVRTAAGGSAALAVVAEWRPDAVLLDVMMPGMDGLATLAALRGSAATADIPVVFLTASVRRAEQGRLVEAGARGAIAKPFDPVTLPGELAALVGW